MERVAALLVCHVSLVRSACPRPAKPPRHMNVPDAPSFPKCLHQRGRPYMKCNAGGRQSLSSGQSIWPLSQGAGAAGAFAALTAFAMRRVPETARRGNARAEVSLMSLISVATGRLPKLAADAEPSPENPVCGGEQATGAVGTAVCPPHNQSAKMQDSERQLEFAGIDGWNFFRRASAQANRS